METPTLSNVVTLAVANLPAGYFEPRWYAAYTSANHERRVATQLGERAVEHFLPQYESVRRWKDRTMKLQLPLFPGYIFVRLDVRERLRVLQIPGVSRLVGFGGGLPTALPDEEIDALRRSLAEGLKPEPHPYLKAGRRMRVKAGPLQGMKGILVRKKNGSRIVISIDVILRSMAVEIDHADLEPA